MEDRRVVYSVLVGNLRGKGHFESPGVNGMIILRWISWKWDVGLWTGTSWLRIGTGGRHL
jgi:hypothetical protein